jgi:hypothetical protein
VTPKEKKTHSTFPVLGSVLWNGLIVRNQDHNLKTAIKAARGAPPGIPERWKVGEMPTGKKLTRPHTHTHTHTPHVNQ